MDNLEQKIVSTASLINPATGHKSRFEMKLKRMKTKKKSLNSQIFVYAAAVALLVSLTFMHLNQFSNNDTHALLIIEKQEFIESELYYQKQIASKIAAIKELDSEHEAVIDEIAEFDESLKILKDDLSQTPGDMRVVEAVLNTYMLKNEALELIVSKLKNLS